MSPSTSTQTYCATPTPRKCPNRKRSGPRLPIGGQPSSRMPAAPKTPVAPGPRPAPGPLYTATILPRHPFRSLHASPFTEAVDVCPDDESLNARSPR